MRFKRYGFVAGLALTILAAIHYPQDRLIHAQLFNLSLSNVAIWLIFFRQGLSIQTSELLAGRSPLKLHAFVLGWNFLLFPAVTAILLFLFSQFVSEELRLGFCLLSVMPTTVAASIALTTAAGGHTANALFSSVYSNLIAIIWVPTVSILYLRFSENPDFGILQALTKLSVLIALPLLIGQIVRNVLHNPSVIICRKTTWFCPTVILWLVYVAFVQSVQSSSFTQLQTKQIAFTVFLSGTILLLVSGLVSWSSHCLQLERDRRVAAFYCASQKSLVTGLPLATTLLTSVGQPAVLAVALLPLLAYHTLQLLLGAGLLSYCRKRV